MSRALLLLSIVLATQSCSIRKMALNSIGGALSNAADEYARDEDSIRISDEVACFPPVSGG